MIPIEEIEIKYLSKNPNGFSIDDIKVKDISSPKKRYIYKFKGENNNTYKFEIFKKEYNSFLHSFFYMIYFHFPNSEKVKKIEGNKIFKESKEIIKKEMLKVGFKDKNFPGLIVKNNLIIDLESNEKEYIIAFKGSGSCFYSYFLEASFLEKKEKEKEEIIKEIESFISGVKNQKKKKEYFRRLSTINFHIKKEKEKEEIKKIKKEILKEIESIKSNSFWNEKEIVPIKTYWKNIIKSLPEYSLSDFIYTKNLYNDFFSFLLNKTTYHLIKNIKRNCKIDSEEIKKYDKDIFSYYNFLDSQALNLSFYESLKYKEKMEQILLDFLVKGFKNIEKTFYRIYFSSGRQVDINIKEKNKIEEIFKKSNEKEGFLVLINEKFPENEDIRKSGKLEKIFWEKEYTKDILKKIIKISGVFPKKNTIELLHRINYNIKLKEITLSEVEKITKKEKEETLISLFKNRILDSAVLVKHFNTEKEKLPIKVI